MIFFILSRFYQNWVFSILPWLEKKTAHILYYIIIKKNSYSFATFLSFSQVKLNLTRKHWTLLTFFTLKLIDYCVGLFEGIILHKVVSQQASSRRSSLSFASRIIVIIVVRSVTPTTCSTAMLIHICGIVVALAGAYPIVTAWIIICTGGRRTTTWWRWAWRVWRSSRWIRISWWTFVARSWAVCVHVRFVVTAVIGTSPITAILIQISTTWSYVKKIK